VELRGVEAGHLDLPEHARLSLLETVPEDHAARNY
jgi:hypothetical protein